MKKHEWRERTEEGPRLFIASHHGAEWTLRSKLKSDEDWNHHDPIELEHWVALRDILWRKYQRKRVPFSQIEQIDKTIDALREELPGRVVEEATEETGE
ncbi:MAG: hypothetical protein AAGH89_02720 [Verrucomicrobiota bacterium]